MNANEEIANNYIASLNLPFRQINTQRILGPAGSRSNFQPPPSTEVFINNLPKNFYENELYPLCRKFGEIQMRIFINHESGGTRSYAYVQYCTLEAAKWAIFVLNKMIVRQNCKINAMVSMNNRKLHLGGLPVDISKEDLEMKISSLVDGLEAVSLRVHKTTASRTSMDSKYAFLEFENNTKAAIAKKKLRSLGNLFEENFRVLVNWSLPFPPLEPHQIQELKKVYVDNVSPLFQYNDFAEIVRRIVGIENVERIYLCRNYGFVHLQSHEMAEYLIEILNGIVFEGQPIQATWAHPPSLINKKPPMEYRSVPFYKRLQKKRMCSNPDHAEEFWDRF